MLKPEIVLPLVSAAIIYLLRIAELRKRRDTVSGPVKEKLTFQLFMLAGTFMLVGSVVEFFLRERQLYWPTFVAGWCCALASFAIRRRAIAALGKFWSLHVEIRDNHQFVQSGPFRWVRHPTYFSMILEIASVALLLNAVWATVLTAMLFLPALVRRLQLEETALIDKFGENYRRYRERTPMLIPYRLPRS